MTNFFYWMSSFLPSTLRRKIFLKKYKKEGLVKKLTDKKNDSFEKYKESFSNKKSVTFPLYFETPDKPLTLVPKITNLEIGCLCCATKIENTLFVTRTSPILIEIKGWGFCPECKLIQPVFLRFYNNGKGSFYIKEYETQL